MKRHSDELTRHNRFFVYVEVNGKVHPQKWADERTQDGRPFPGVRAVNKHELSNRAYKYFNLDKLQTIYPYVPPVDTSGEIEKVKLT